MDVFCENYFEFKKIIQNVKFEIKYKKCKSQPSRKQYRPPWVSERSLS